MDRVPSAALIGAGAMGGALLRGWIAAGTIDPARSAVIDPAAEDLLRLVAGETGVNINPKAEDIAAVDVLILAIKPQSVETVAPLYAGLAAKALVLSVMAGVSVATLSRLLGGAKDIVRAMPNLPAAVGAGMSGLFAAPDVAAARRDLAERLMGAVGETAWVDSEEALAAVTAVSGSGPAYFFLLTEALAEAGVDLGLDWALAVKLARTTAEGAGAMLAADPRPPAAMRQAVTSPGGTTAAALSVLDGESAALRTLLREAVAAAAARARQLTE